MADEKRGWKQFQKLTFDSKKLSKHVKKAEGATTRHARKFIVTRLDNIRSVRRHVIGWLLLVGAMIVAVGVQFMWFQQSYQTTAAARGGTYAEASLGPIDTLNPLYASTSAEVAASRLLFSSLYSYDSTGHLKGDLAENMQTDPTGTIYTIKLRDDARWQDGTLLTAEDVAFTVDLIKNPETRSPLRINWQDVTVKALDDRTIQFQLPAVYAAFPNALTFSVLPQHILNGVAPGAVRENTFSQSPVGSGPFTFNLLQTAADTKYNHKIVHMTANEHYYGGRPMLSRFEIHSYNTQEGILSALRTGEVTAAADLNGIDASEIDSHNYDISARPINSGVYAMFNGDTPILKDKAVRQALALGTDTKVLRSKFSVAVPALDSPFITGQLTGSDVPHPAAPDRAKAAALLDQSGWTLVGGVRKKGDQKLELTIATTKNAQYERALESLVGQWRNLGVVVHTNIVNTADPSTNFVQNVLQARNYDVLLYELFIGADPDVYAYWHSSQIGLRGYNFSNYASTTSDDALASARSRLEPDLRNAKYKSFARQWIDDVPAIGLYQPVAQYAYNKHVHSLDTSATLISSYDRYSNVLDWSVDQKSVYKTP
ncbi:MAG: putative Extracellular solute-binding protein family 5 [Candidatus Saccharibacteria bacterium]|nr:putative Extracellular solute-binding protein family 5 [Candidatus Saccharibacteria bacterium]